MNPLARTLSATHVALAFALVATFDVSRASAATSANAGATTDSCSTSAAIAAVADALTSGSDAAVLRASVAGSDRLRACGNVRDSVSLQLIAADAYGDTNNPGARCRALSDAHVRLAKLGDASRAGAVGRALAACSATTTAK